MHSRVQLYLFNAQLADEKQRFLDKQQQDLQVFLANQEARKQAFTKNLNNNNMRSINANAPADKCVYVPLPPIPFERQREEEYTPKSPLPMPKPRVVDTLKSIENNNSFMKNRTAILKASKRLNEKTKIWNRK